MAAMIEFVCAQQVFELLRPRDAVAAIEQALLGGFDPADDPPRTIVDVAQGQLLLMASQCGTAVGTKLASVAPGNPSRGLDKIQALYVHFDAESLTPRLLMDGTALTTLRTPAVSFAAVRPVLSSGATALDVVVFGAGPQAVGHIRTLCDVVEGLREITSITCVVRHPERVDPAGLGAGTQLVAAGSSEALRAVATADLIVCATGSAVPVFDSTQAREDVIVLAVGSHDPHRREVDTALCARAQVIVETRHTALRECGDIVMANAEGALGTDSLVPMADLICGRTTLQSGRSTLFKSAGMAWQDVTVAAAIAHRLSAGG